MMTVAEELSRHYASGNVLGAIQRGIQALGKTPATITIDDLALADQFHVGGRTATEHFLDQLNLAPDMNVLDVGCGIGGPARFAASRYKCRVAGIDLTPEFIEAGSILCQWVGLDDRVSLRAGSALSLDFQNDTFDAAYMLHVGMNIKDKERLFAEVSRVLRAGSRFGVYDVMRIGDGDLIYPVPWATQADQSAVAEPSHYRSALQAAGFEIAVEHDRRDFALAFYHRTRANIAAAGGPPPFGTHLLMGKNAADKSKNMAENLSAGRVAPIEMIAMKK
jgi:SAM-dependent methyltransferase